MPVRYNFSELASEHLHGVFLHFPELPSRGVLLGRAAFERAMHGVGVDNELFFAHRDFQQCWI